MGAGLGFVYLLSLFFKRLRTVVNIVMSAGMMWGQQARNPLTEHPGIKCSTIRLRWYYLAIFGNTILLGMFSVFTSNIVSGVFQTMHSNPSACVFFGRCVPFGEWLWNVFGLCARVRFQIVAERYGALAVPNVRLVAIKGAHWNRLNHSDERTKGIPRNHWSLSLYSQIYWFAVSENDAPLALLMRYF